MEKHMLQNSRTEMSQPLIVPDNSSKEDPLSNLSRSLDKENECCLPHYITDQTMPTCYPYASDRLKVTIANADRTACSSSCENLRVSNREKDSLFDSKLSKANSDNPVFGSQSSNCMPPIPPRDYLWHAPSKTPKTIEIHPVLQDGEKLSNTHYWLLPGKQQYMKDANCEAKEGKKKVENYINFKEAVACEKANRNSDQSKNSVGNVKNKLHSKDLKIGRLLCDGRTAVDDDEPLLDAGCDNAIEGAYDNMTIQAMLDPEIKFNSHLSLPRSDELFDEKCASLGEAKDMIEVVHSAVEGVSLEECQTALSLLHWNADAAVKYLKVESLFRLALASRSRCKQVLELNHWDLNKAASDLLDLSAI